MIIQLKLNPDEDEMIIGPEQIEELELEHLITVEELENPHIGQESDHSCMGKTTCRVMIPNIKLNKIFLQIRDFIAFSAIPIIPPRSSRRMRRI